MTRREERRAKRPLPKVGAAAESVDATSDEIRNLILDARAQGYVDGEIEIPVEGNSLFGRIAELVGKSGIKFEFKFNLPKRRK